METLYALHGFITLKYIHVFIPERIDNLSAT